MQCGVGKNLRSAGANSFQKVADELNRQGITTVLEKKAQCPFSTAKEASLVRTEHAEVAPRQRGSK
jgi:hypothetical protein